MTISDPKTAPADPSAWWISLLLAVITVLVYLPAGFDDFILFDDPSYVTNNPVVQNGLSWAGLKWAFLGWHASNWHPLTWLSHQLDCQLFGLNAGAHHLVNVLFHTANTVLLFQFWWRLTKALWPSALVAALFAWHPLHVESVAWVAERKDVLSTFFGLLTMLAYACYVEESKVQSLQSKVGGPWAKVWYGVSLGLFALGLLAKPMLVTLPFVLLLLDYWPLRRFTAERRWLVAGGQLAWEKAPFFLLTALSCLCTYLAQRAQAVISLAQLPAGLRLENAVVATAGYVGKTLWPVNLAIFYPMPQHYPAWKVALSAFGLVAVSLTVWRVRRKHACWLIGWLWFLGILAPVIGLVQVGNQAMADRYTYLPAVGLFVAIVFGLSEVWQPFKTARTALGLAGIGVLAACVAVTEHQLMFWKNTETVFQRDAAVTQNNAPAHMTLAVFYKQQGRMEESQQEYQKAMACFSQVMVPGEAGKARPASAQLLQQMGQIAEAKGDLEEAMGNYRDAERQDPNFFEVRTNLGGLLKKTGQADEALAEFHAAVQLRPDDPAARENLGTLLAKAGRFDEALAEYQAAARLTPDDPQPAYLIGRTQLRRGQTAAAVSAFQTALRLNPRDIPSLVYLARVRAADQSPESRNGAEAVRLAEQANQLTSGTQAFVLGTLAMAYAEAGRFDEARKTIQAALRLNLVGGPETAAALQAQLKRYEAGQPDRESFASPARSPDGGGDHK